LFSLCVGSGVQPISVPNGCETNANQSDISSSSGWFPSMFIHLCACRYLCLSILYNITIRVVVDLDTSSADEDADEFIDMADSGILLSFWHIKIIIYTYSCFVGDQESEYLNIGGPTYLCQKCGAMMWYEERVPKHTKPVIPRFSMCCLKGRVVLPPYERLPQFLHDMYHKHDRVGRFFMDNIRSFNSMFAFTSMGGRVDNTQNNGRAPPMFVMNGENYHFIGSLLPMPEKPPKFAQLYIYDTENEITNRMASVR